MRGRWWVVVGLALWGSSRVWAANGAVAGQDYIFTVTEENDKFVLPQTDKHYTQGLHFQLLWPDGEVPLPLKPLSWLPDFGLTNGHKYGVRAGQNIYTPRRTETKALQKDDRPYAGWLFAGFLRQNRGRGPGNLPTLDHWEINLGVVGPYSLADNTQIWFHGLIEVDEPNGWRYQIKNEPALLLIGRRTLRLADTGPPHAWRAQWLGAGEINLGNVETSLRVSTEGRFGHNLPDEFALNYPVAWGWYLFGGISARLVGYSLFLDGNTYTDSHHVDKDTFVPAARGGVMFELQRAEIGFTYNFVVREFKKQEDSDAYATLTFTYRF
jgi:hypothetical protein